MRVGGRRQPGVRHAGGASPAGVSINFRRGKLVTAAGIAPVGARAADVAFGDLIYPFRVRAGVFGAAIVKRIHEPVRVSYR